MKLFEIHFLAQNRTRRVRATTARAAVEQITDADVLRIKFGFDFDFDVTLMDGTPWMGIDIVSA